MRRTETYVISLVCDTDLNGTSLDYFAIRKYGLLTLQKHFNQTFMIRPELQFFWPPG